MFKIMGAAGPAVVVAVVAGAAVDRVVEAAADIVGTGVAEVAVDIESDIVEVFPSWSQGTRLQRLSL